MPILASEATRLAAREAIRFGAMRSVHLRGRTEPIAVYVPEAARVP